MTEKFQSWSNVACSTGIITCFKRVFFFYSYFLNDMKLRLVSHESRQGATCL